MKNLKDYILESTNATVVDFSKLSDIGDAGVISEITKANLNLMISPEDEKFGHQRMTIYWGDNSILFVMPNNFTNGSPTKFEIRLDIKSSGIKNWHRGHDFVPGDFKVSGCPAALKILGVDVKEFEKQLCELVCMIMNRQPEPLD